MSSKILSMFANALTVDDKYSRDNREAILQHVETIFSRKPITIRQIFIACFKCIWDWALRKK